MTRKRHRQKNQKTERKPSRPHPPENFWCRDCNAHHSVFRWQLLKTTKIRCSTCGGPLLSAKEAREARLAYRQSQPNCPSYAVVGFTSPSTEEPSGYAGAGLQKADQTPASAMLSEM